MEFSNMRTFLIKCLVLNCCFTCLAAAFHSDLASCSAEVQQMSSIQRVQRTIKAWNEQLKMEDYALNVAPDFPNMTNVSIFTWPFSISRVNEFDQTIRITTGLRMKWLDKRLAFQQHRNACTFPHRERFSVLFTTSSEQQTIWLPTFYMHGRQESSSDEFLKMIELFLYPDGHVEMMAFFHEIRMCSIRTRRFPFDKQSCPLKLEAFHQVDLTHDVETSNVNMLRVIERYRHRSDVVEMEYETNEWQIYGYENDIIRTFSQIRHENYGNQSSIVIYPLYLTRKSSQHIVNWILSPIVLSFSSVIGLYQGCDVSERFGYGGSIVVTLTLMINELRNVLGYSADGYPILSMMYIGLELTLILATLLSGMPRRICRQRQAKRSDSLFACSSTTDVHNKTRSEKSKTRGVSGIITKSGKRIGRLTRNWGCGTYDTVLMLFLLVLQLIVIGIATLMWLKH